MARRLTLALLPLALLAAATPAGAQERPNVVVMMTDDQTLESMRVMSRTRRLLGGRGATFGRAIASYPLCCPSRATLFTGMYAHNHGVLGNRPPFGGYAVLDTSDWLPVWLQRAGYRTAHVGKFLNGYGRDNGDPTEVPQGWDEWHGSVDPSTYRFWGYTLNENGRLRAYPDDYGTDLYGRKGAELVERLAPSSRPFFLSVGFLAPHAGGPREPGDPDNLTTPAVAPRHRGAFLGAPLPGGRALNEASVLDKPASVRVLRRISLSRIAKIRQSYQQSLESLLAVDEAVARIVGALRESGELANTLVLFTSDNGFFFGEHRIAYGKLRAYEPSIRVPLLLRGPGVPAGVRRRQLVSNVDLAPTILDAAGIRRRGLDGRSLLWLARDRRLRWRRDLLLQGGESRAGAYRGLRTERWTYVAHASGERELYDLRRDPLQLRSRHADPSYAWIADRLAARLRRLRLCEGAACRRPPPPRLRVPGDR